MADSPIDPTPVPGGPARDAIGWLPATGLPPNVVAGVTLAAPGVSTGPYAAPDGTPGLNLGDHVGDAERDVAHNRATLQRRLPQAPVWLQQVHGTDVLTLPCTQKSDSLQAPQADASVTAQLGTVCAILTADCLPILMADEQGRVVGAAHAGWRGLLHGVLGTTVAAMQAAHQAQYGVPLTSLQAWIGPGIGPEAYEVGPEFQAAFEALDPGTGAYFRPGRGDRRWVDLPGLAQRALSRLADAQGLSLQVSLSGICTFSDRRFYSYRRQATTGRFASLIWRRA